ncbi:MAG TPA: TetR/AcrR family transcriptional regulator [Niabella sp.]
MSSVTDTEMDILPGQILQAALELYLKYGLKKVTMDDVSKVIGKSRSSIYYYYKNRDEIFEAVMDALIADVLREMETAIKAKNTLPDKIRAFCLAKIRTSEEKKPLFAAIEAGMNADERSSHAKTMLSLHQRLMKAETILLKNMLSAAIKSGAIRALKPREQETFIFILLSSIRGIKREMIYENDFSRLSVTVDTLTAMAASWMKQ